MYLSLVPAPTGLLLVKLGNPMIVMCCWNVWAEQWGLADGGTLGLTNPRSCAMAVYCLTVVSTVNRYVQFAGHLLLLLIVCLHMLLLYKSLPLCVTHG